MLLWWSCQSPVAHSCSLLNHPNSFHRGIFKINAKFDAKSLLYSLSHFECDNRLVHMLTQCCLPPPLTVKLPLFTHVHSSPLSSIARLHPCCANCFYINNGCNFPRQISHKISTGRQSWRDQDFRNWETIQGWVPCISFFLFLISHSSYSRSQMT